MKLKILILQAFRFLAVYKYANIVIKNLEFCLVKLDLHCFYAITQSMKEDKSFHNQMGMYFFIATMVFSGLWASYFLLINNSIDLGELETEEPDSAKTLSQEEINKPWLTTDGLVVQGSKVYKAQCALCHGKTGLGDGTPGLIPPVRNLVEGKWKQGGSSRDLFATLQTGIAGSSMVSFKHLPAGDRWALVHYIRSITQNKIPDNIKELEEFAKSNL